MSELQRILAGLGQQRQLRRSEQAARLFLNPQVPYAVKDDPDGKHHFGLNISDAYGRPLKGLRKGQPIPLLLRHYQAKTIDHDRKRRVLRYGRRCVVAGTPVLLADGSWKPIEAFEGGERVVSRGRDGLLVARKVVLPHENGVRPVYEVRLSNGLSLTCTENHPLLVQGETGFQMGSKLVWRSIEDGLAVGDKVAVVDHYDVWGDVHDPDLGAIMGYLLTDGYLQADGQTPKFVSTNGRMAYNFSAHLLRRFGFAGVWGQDDGEGLRRFDVRVTPGRRRGRRGCPNEAVAAFAEMDVLGRKADRKRLPSCVYTWDKRTALTMINRMFSGDGTIYVREREGRAPATEACLCSASRELLEEVRLILLKLGIVGRVDAETRATNRSGGRLSTLYKLRIADTESLERFLDQVGDIFGKEEACARMREALSRKNRKRRGGRGKSVRLVTVKAITPKGEAETYDIEVAGTHCFVGGGIIQHNTGKSFSVSVDVCLEAVSNPNAKILILAPNESHIKVLFDDYIRPLLSTFRHKGTTAVGLVRADRPPTGHDLCVLKDTQKPQEIWLSNGARIKGMVIAPSARGQTATYIVIDEADYADTDDIKKIVGPIMISSPETRVIMSSTPTGRTDSYFYEACHNKKLWEEFHYSFEVLPHYSQDLRDEIIQECGGEDSNAFQQEYMAEWGVLSEGVFPTRQLNLSFIVAPYVRVLESYRPRTRERVPLLASVGGDGGERFADYGAGVQPHAFAVEAAEYGLYAGLGAESLWRPGLPGTITAGTDWNEQAGMQTVVIWWPDKEWLAQGELQVARFAYAENGQPVTSERAKTPEGLVRAFTVGSTNGEPGGAHDLSQVEGIVIWHGRLEAGRFNWQSAANRVAAIMSVPGFIQAWYVDYGYGKQVVDLIKGIMESGEYIADMTLLSRARPIEPQLLRNIRAFHPDQDPERTGRLFRTVQFGAPYERPDIDYKMRRETTKDVMIGIAQRLVAQRRVLLPYGELARLATAAELGEATWSDFDEARGAFTGEHRAPVVDRDIIEPTGGEEARTGTFGGLVSQMRQYRVEGVTPTGRPRYAGTDHAIDAFMLAVLAYEENYRAATADNVVRRDSAVRAALAEDVLGYARKRAAEAPGARKVEPVTVHTQGFTHKNYRSSGDGGLAPLREMVAGRLKPEDAGTSLPDMLAAARRHLRRQA